MSPLLQTILQQVELLSDQECLELIQQVAEQMKSRPSEPRRKHKISEFQGIVKYPFCGEDAQEWVTRNREDDEHWEQLSGEKN